MAHDRLLFNVVVRSVVRRRANLPRHVRPAAKNVAALDLGLRFSTSGHVSVVDIAVVQLGPVAGVAANLAEANVSLSLRFVVLLAAALVLVVRVAAQAD